MLAFIVKIKFLNNFIPSPNLFFGGVVKQKYLKKQKQQKSTFGHHRILHYLRLSYPQLIQILVLRRIPIALLALKTDLTNQYWAKINQLTIHNSHTILIQRGFFFWGSYR